MAGDYTPIGAGGWWQSYTDQWSNFGGVFGNGVFSSVGRRIVNSNPVIELRFQTSADYTASYNAWVRYIKVSPASA
jgi:hypothetical protein